MNNLKFRAWSVDNKRTYYAAPYRGYIKSDGIWWGLYNGDDVEVASSANDILMQYTGLKDINGVEIYVGDLIEVPNDYDTYGMMAGCIREVYFKDGSYRLKPLDNLHNQRGHLIDDCNDLKVIGNIHENGELLK